MVSHPCAESVRLLATEPGLEQELKEAFMRNHLDAEVLLRARAKERARALGNETPSGTQDIECERLVLIDK